MTRLQLSLAVGDYDRTRPLLDGRVRIDGVDAVPLALTPEEIFFAAFRHQSFDICELSFSSYLVQTAAGHCPYVGVPVFPSRAFRHAALHVRKDRIRCPEDLKGRRVGVPEYQLSANVWARALLADDHGVQPEDIIWVRGGIVEPARPEKLRLALPPGVRVEQAPEGQTISALLDRGEIDGFIAPRAPHGTDGNPDVGWLFDDPTAAARDYYARTGIFPIMHLVGVRRRLAEAHPWLPAAVMKAFQAAKGWSLEQLEDTSATKVTLPFVEEQLKRARSLMGHDFWPYGVDPNRRTLEAFARHHHAQGLSARQVAVDEMFHPSTYSQAQI